MVVTTPPRPPRHDDLEALIKEARRRQRRRRLIAAGAVFALVSAGVAADESFRFGTQHSVDNTFVVPVAAGTPRRLTSLRWTLARLGGADPSRGSGTRSQ